MERIEECLKAVCPPEPLPPGEEAVLPIPKRGLGALGELGRRLRAIYRSRGREGGPTRRSGEPGSPLRKLLLIAAADHGVASAGVSRYPQGTTSELVRDVLAGRAAVARLAPRHQVRAVVVDFGLATKPEAETEATSADGQAGPAGWAEFRSARLGAGTGDISKEPAMTRDAALDSIRAGIDSLEDLCKGWDVDLVGVGDLGLGSTTSACAVAAVLTGLPVDALCCDRGIREGADRSRAEARAGLVRRALERATVDPDDAIAVLAEYGGLETGALVGVCLAAAARRTPVLLDGVVSAAAAALAARLAPAARSYFIASHEAAIPAHGALLDELELVPILRLGLDLGEGAGAVLAVGLVEAAWVLARGD